MEPSFAIFINNGSYGAGKTTVLDHIGNCSQPRGALSV